MDLGTGTRVLVTGASRGIGEALVRAFAARGCTLGLVSRSEEELERLAGSLPGNSHRAIPAHRGDADSGRKGTESFGEREVFVVNAGIAHYGSFQELRLEKAEQMTRVNWLGTLYSVDAALPRMLERGRGHLAIVSSGAGFRAFPQASVYGATKAAQRAFAEALRHELAGTGVSVTTVFPGEIRSHLHDHDKAAMPAWYQYDNAADPDELAKRVVDAVEKDQRSVLYP